MTKIFHRPAINSRRLDRAFSFLQENTKYNQIIQNRTYRDWLCPCANVADSLSSLLFSNVTTQPLPKLDHLSHCWKKLHLHRHELGDVTDIGGLASWISKYLLEKQTVDPGYTVDEFKRLWVVLKNVNGWGEKTAALFIKSLINIHVDPANKDLRFLRHFKISNLVQPYLPVDKVIKHIFEHHFASRGSLSFTGINKELWARYSSTRDLIVWDELWFWGFITQRSRASTRITELNMSKFWAIRHAPGDLENEVEDKAHEFIKILRSRN
jgi:hypothetical protein